MSLTAASLQSTSRPVSGSYNQIASALRLKRLWNTSVVCLNSCSSAPGLASHLLRAAQTFIGLIDQITRKANRAPARVAPPDDVEFHRFSTGGLRHFFAPRRWADQPQDLKLIRA